MLALGSVLQSPDDMTGHVVRDTYQLAKVEVTYKISGNTCIVSRQTPMSRLLKNTTLTFDSGLNVFSVFFCKV